MKQILGKAGSKKRVASAQAIPAYDAEFASAPHKRLLLQGFSSTWKVWDGMRD
ncbi:hypothetical protein [Chitiniphilus eburneus]|uniref:hypothetical protein n=1 Tax=Chitiniphilus eburneus TaxID=2571148 RepID=UPI00145E4546|nr:hypothetical protein [Chitiniphilus eburneus]